MTVLATERGAAAPRWEGVVTDELGRVDTWTADNAVRECAAWIVADTVCAADAARSRPELRALAKFASAGHAVALVEGWPRVDVASAALVNGTAGTWLELDEAADPGVHAVIHVVAPAQAVAQQMHASGEALLAAFIAGYEVTAALYGAFVPRYPVHPHAGLAVVGGAVAAARLSGQESLAVARVASAVPVKSSWALGSRAQRSGTRSPATRRRRCERLGLRGPASAGPARPPTRGSGRSSTTGPSRTPRINRTCCATGLLR